MASVADESASDVHDESRKARARPAWNPGSGQHSVTRFSSVVFDVDSTLSNVEGIDWLAALRGAEVEEWSAALTAKAMAGGIPIEAVYSERMAVVRPTRAEIEELGKVYLEFIASGARETIAELRDHDIELIMVSGGLREAILPLATQLGIPEQKVHAVSVFFSANGDYAGFDERSLFTQQTGKRMAVEKMGLPGPVLAVGDGMTDAEMRSVVNGFAAFTGFKHRAQVVELADYVIESFEQLRNLVLE
jgi:phosphoserine phosphatase